MTAICGGGTSSLKPGSGSIIVGASATLEQIFAATPVAWAKFALVLVPVATYNLLNICITDPPAMPTFTAGEVFALIGLIPGAELTSAIAKMPDLITNVLWNQFCQCDSGATPTQTALPPAPTTVASPGAQPLWSEPVLGLFGAFSTISSANTYGPKATMVQDATAVQLANWNTDNISSHQLGMWVNHTLRARVTTSGEVLNHETFTSIPPVQLYKGDLVQLGIFRPPNTTWRQNTSAQGAGPGNLISGFGSGFILASTLQEPNTNFAVAEWVNVYVTQQAQGLANTCCPPDPGVIALLSNILAGVNALGGSSSTVGYTISTPHTGLTGTGTITVSRLAGVSVTLTTVPSSVGTELGTPLEIFEAGWINWGTVDGFILREFIHSSPQLSFPNLAAQYTRVAYSFPPGVVAEIIELLPA